MDVRDSASPLLASAMRSLARASRFECVTGIDGRSLHSGREPGRGLDRVFPPCPPGGQIRGRSAGHAGQGSRYYPGGDHHGGQRPSPRRHRPAALVLPYTRRWDTPAVSAPRRARPGDGSRRAGAKSIASGDADACPSRPPRALGCRCGGSAEVQPQAAVVGIDPAAGRGLLSAARRWQRSRVAKRGHLEQGGNAAAEGP
jgi:hypothetical protein